MKTARLELEQLEERQLLSTVQIFAAGFEGDEIFSLQIDEQVVATFEAGGDPTTGDLRTFEYTTQQTVTADQIRVALENDAFDAQTGFDRNLRVDAIAIDGVRYESESVHTLSTGTYFSGAGVTPGFHETEALHSNGFLQFSSNTDQGPLIRFRVRGSEGGEQFDLRIDGETVQSYEAFDGFIIYGYQAQEPTAIESRPPTKIYFRPELGPLKMVLLTGSDVATPCIPTVSSSLPIRRSMEPARQLSSAPLATSAWKN